MVSKRNRGFTLIELMIGVSLSIALMMLAIPFTISWMDSSRQLQARGDLADAVGRAKSIALRNERNLASNVPAARLAVAGGNIEVRDSLDAVVWSSALPRGVQLRRFDDSGAFLCSAYNSRGWLIDGGATCNETTSRLLVQIAGQDNLNVELL